jgi:beta-galactosidase/beta-glucuronidase
LNQQTWLVFDRLDYSVIIYLNGKEIGRHPNAYLPCRIDTSGLLKAGAKEITVGIESGYFTVADKNGVTAFLNSLVKSATNIYTGVV